MTDHTPEPTAPDAANPPDPAREPSSHSAPSDGASTPVTSHEEAKRAIEAVVMVADEPVDPQLLGQLVELGPAAVEQLCADLAAEYLAEGRGFQLVRVAGGYRYQSHPDQAPYIERFVLDGQSARLSAAALETLAIVAYKQPISRAQVAAIRGVGVDGVMRTLQQRGYIEEIGRDTGPGQAVLFGTSQTFLERLGLDSLADLPALGDFVPGADVVEALEHGLRAEPSDPVVDPDDLDAPDDAPDGATATELDRGLDVPAGDAGIPTGEIPLLDDGPDDPAPA